MAIVGEPLNRLISVACQLWSSHMHVGMQEKD